jgi:hypothetical protein
MAADPTLSSAPAVIDRTRVYRIAMPSVRARVLTLSAVAAVTFGGCASVGRFDSDPAHSVELAGSWTLDRAASDDPKPLLEKLRPKISKYHGMPPDDGTGEDSSQSPGGGQGGGSRGGGRSRRGGGQQTQGDPSYRATNEAYTHGTVAKMLMADLARAEQLTVRQGPERFSLDYGSQIRNFTPGAKSVVSADWGVADQSSGWKGKEYVIEIKPQQGVAAIEKYGLSEDGKHLIEKLRLGGGEFPVVELKRVYDHSDKILLRAAPTND